MAEEEYRMNKQWGRDPEAKSTRKKPPAEHEAGGATLPHIHIHTHAGGHTLHVMHHDGSHEKHQFSHGDAEGMADKIHEHYGNDVDPGGETVSNEQPQEAIPL